MKSNLRLVLCSIIFLSTELHAASFDWGRNFYTDLTRRTIIDQLNLSLTNPTELNKYDTIFGFGYTGKNHRLVNADGTTALLIKNERGVDEQNPNPISFDDHAITFNVSQNLGLLSNLSLSSGYSTSDLGSSVNVSLSYSQWLRSETLQTTLSIGYLKTTQEPDIYPSGNDQTDFIITEESIDGLDLSLQVYHLTTPSFLWRGGATVIFRSDRPLAYVANLEGRYFVKKTQSSLHLKGNYYKNIDFQTHADLIDDVSLISVLGQLSAYSAAAELHQKIARTILSIGYRTYFESNVSQFISPITNEPTYDFKTGSDYIYGSLRWRFSKEIPWTASSSPEVFIFGGYYDNNEPPSSVSDGANTAFNFGLGSSLHF